MNKRTPTKTEQIADAKYRRLGLPPLPNIKPLGDNRIQVVSQPKKESRR